MDIFPFSIAVEFLSALICLILYLRGGQTFSLQLALYCVTIFLCEVALLFSADSQFKFIIIFLVLAAEAGAFAWIVRQFTAGKRVLKSVANMAFLLNLSVAVLLQLGGYLTNRTIYWFAGFHFGVLAFVSTLAIYLSYFDVKEGRREWIDYQFVIWSAVLIYAPLQMVRVMLVPFFIEYYNITHFSLGRLITNIACVFLYSGLALAAYLQYRQSKTAKAA